MKIVHITPGAGGMYCGNCFRDNALVKALRQTGEETVMVPLYLPMTLDEPDQSAGVPIFFGGINVYLEEKFPFFRSAPHWLKHLLDHPALLRLASGKAAKTRAADVGDLTLSMLRGEEGNQSRDLEELVAWLKSSGRPDVVCLSNALLAGLARRLKQAFRAPVVCFLQGEDSFLDELPASHRQAAWQTLRERAADIDLFIAPSRYFADTLRPRLGLRPDQVEVIHNGMSFDGYEPALTRPDPPVLGYFARMCREKGLDTLVDAFIRLKTGSEFHDLQLRVGGSCGPADHPFVYSLQQKLSKAGLDGQFEFHPNVDRAAKQSFYQSLTLLSVPARYGEAFGLYLIEAMGCGIPVIQPRTAAFTELVELSGGGVLFEPENPEALALRAADLLRDPARWTQLSLAGRKAALAEFTIERMAAKVTERYRQLVRARETARTPEETGKN